MIGDVLIDLSVDLAIDIDGILTGKVHRSRGLFLIRTTQQTSQITLEKRLVALASNVSGAVASVLAAAEVHC